MSCNYAHDYPLFWHEMVSLSNIINKGKALRETHQQESASAFMTGGPTALMPDTLRLRRDPLSVSAASPTLVILVQRLRDATCAVIIPSGILFW